MGPVRIGKQYSAWLYAATFLRCSLRSRAILCIPEIALPKSDRGNGKLFIQRLHHSCAASASGAVLDPGLDGVFLRTNLDRCGWSGRSHNRVCHPICLVSGKAETIQSLDTSRVALC